MMALTLLCESSITQSYAPRGTCVPSPPSRPDRTPPKPPSCAICTHKIPYETIHAGLANDHPRTEHHEGGRSGTGRVTRHGRGDRVLATRAPAAEAQRRSVKLYLSVILFIRKQYIQLFFMKGNRYDYFTIHPTFSIDTNRTGLLGQSQYQG